MNILSKNQLKYLAAYKSQKHCEEDSLFVVEGIKMCEEAIASGFTIRTACFSNDYLHSTNADPQLEYLSLKGCELYEVSDEQLERLSNMRTPNKIWMLLERYGQNNLTLEPQTLTLALDDIQDPGNMGTIIRTADWYGIRHIVCSPNTVSCFNPKVVQATMGAIFRTKIEYRNLVDWIHEASEKGLSSFAAMLDGKPYQNIKLSKPAILVIGNESNGISLPIANLVQHQLSIPNIGGTCESLNAAVAAAILISEFYR